jgi:hypothetical protein
MATSYGQRCHGSFGAAQAFTQCVSGAGLSQKAFSASNLEQSELLP